MTKNHLERLRDLAYAAGQQNIKGRQDEELRLLRETSEIIEALDLVGRAALALAKSL